MRIKLNTLQVLLFLFIFQADSKAIKCYQCNSRKDDDCTQNKVDIKYLKPCPLSHRYCRKAISIYYFMESREYITVRECARWRNTDKPCYRGRYSRDSYQLVCECYGTGCNRSARHFSNMSIFLYVLCQLVILLGLSPT
ncbi:uncharacterized protein LOC117228985 [Megalopta genalis]|uniref:uncharacterized protein LOC117228985 n=1 Tax=Megalopta genalis TaxID=115081 RepID=UPI00144361FE|nr:uncharacterized protein LOC117228985 [Megalopta genalis]